MKYIADTLTFSRYLLAPVVLWATLGERWTVALAVFAAGISTDALDGIFARGWPYSRADEARLPWRRLDMHKVDSLADALLIGAALVALAIVFPHRWVWIDITIAFVSVVIKATVQWMAQRGWRAAEVVDVIHGWLYAAILALIVVELTRLAGWPWQVVTAGLVALPILLVAKWDRATTRPETRKLVESYALPSSASKSA